MSILYIITQFAITLPTQFKYSSFSSLPLICRNLLFGMAALRLSLPFI
jgi:hypothetical protein